MKLIIECCFCKKENEIAVNLDFHSDLINRQLKDIPRCLSYFELPNGNMACFECAIELLPKEEEIKEN